MSKERPILFSAPMVRAILAEAKTQTRRAVKPQPPEWVQVWNGCDGLEHFFFDREEDDESGQHWPGYAQGLRCPYGQTGDRLWVREAWLTSSAHDDLAPREIPFGDDVEYQASHPRVLTGKTRPGIHMPRWASRITLEVTGVRAERLQYISEADALAEGPPKHFLSWRDNFCALWQEINGPSSWDANPWVWVVKFRRV